MPQILKTLIWLGVLELIWVFMAFTFWVSQFSMPPFCWGGLVGVVGFRHSRSRYFEVFLAFIALVLVAGLADLIAGIQVEQARSFRSIKPWPWGIAWGVACLIAIIAVFGCFW